MSALISKRLDLDTFGALEAIAEHEPTVSQRLARSDARLVAAFHRMDGHDSWRTMIFAVAHGTECWTLAEEWSNRDDHGTWVEDYQTVVVERSNAYGDAWPSGSDDARLFLAPSGARLYPSDEPPFGW